MVAGSDGHAHSPAPGVEGTGARWLSAAPALILAFLAGGGGGRAGLAVNVAATLLIAGGGGGHGTPGSLNLAGAFKHIVTDLYAFAATAIAGIVILATGFARADAIATLVVVVLMVHAGAGPIRQSGRIFPQAAPAGPYPAAGGAGAGQPPPPPGGPQPA